MLKSWFKNPKRKIKKRLGKLSKKHEKVAKGKSVEGCKDFLNEVAHLREYVGEKIGTDNPVYGWLYTLYDFCQRNQRKGKKDWGLSMKQGIFPKNFSFTEGKTRYILGSKPAALSFNPRRACLEFSEKINYLRDEILPDV